MNYGQTIFSHKSAVKLHTLVVAGRSNCSSAGSNSISGSNPSMALPKTRLKLRSGLRYLFTFWWPLSKNVSTSIAVCSRFCKFSVSRFSRKRPSSRLLTLLVTMKTFPLILFN